MVGYRNESPTPNCSGGSHDPTRAHRLAGRAQAIGTEYPSYEFAGEHKGMGVRLAGDRPGTALFRSRSGDRPRPATDARRNRRTYRGIQRQRPALQGRPCRLAQYRRIEDRWQLTITAQRVALTRAAHPKGGRISGMRGRTDMDLEGGCACGAVRYRLTAPPLIVHACHCRDCQKQSGSAFVLNMWSGKNCVEAENSLPKSC